MGERIRNYSSRIIFDQEARDFIWQECSRFANQQYPDVNQEYARSCCASINYAWETAEGLVLIAAQEFFSIKEIERLFGVSCSRQRSLIKRGLSPARLKDGRPFYSRRGAEELLMIEELKRFYPFDRNLESMFLEKVNFPYWSIVNKKVGMDHWLPSVEFNPHQRN